MTLGGRAAEELVFNEVTTGAANDLEKVTHTAKQMIMRFGMSEKLGPRARGRQDMPFLGREMASEPDYSEDMARDIDEEIHLVIEDGHRRARNVLEEHIEELHKLSGILIERETIDKDQFSDCWPARARRPCSRRSPSRPRRKARKPPPTSASACRGRSRSRCRARRCSHRRLRELS